MTCALLLYIANGGSWFFLSYFQPVKSESDSERDSSLKVVSFERTPIMSTYLLAFVIGEYDFVEDKDADGVLVRVYTPTGKKEQGQFALEVSEVQIYSVVIE